MDFSKCSKIVVLQHVEQFPLENQLVKCDDRVPLPIDLLARLAFQWLEKVPAITMSLRAVEL